MLELAKSEDIEQIFEIISEAQLRMKADGLLQWQDGYPNRETLADDIKLKQMYKLVIGGDIAGVCVINDDYYQQYVNGPDRQQSRIIHRVAVSGSFIGQGIGHKLLTAASELIAEQGFKFAIIDTCSKNTKMINLIDRCGFHYISDFSLIEDYAPWQLFVKQLSE